MYIKENMLVKYVDGKVVRVIYINNRTSILYLIDMYSNKLPYAITEDELISDLESSECIVLDTDEYCRAVIEEQLNNNEIAKRDSAWNIVMYLLSKVEEEHLFINKYRTEVIKEATKVFNVNEKTIKNYLIRYYKGGKTRNSLLPNYVNCGASGKERNSGALKRGRKSEGGVNVDEYIKKVFKKGLNIYFYNKRNNTLKTAYELTIKEFFTKEQVEQNGIRVPILFDSSKIPTYQQFLYWYNKFNNTKTEISKRKGERIYQQNYRTIIGDATQDAGLGCGDCFQIDANLFDIYLCSSYNRDIIVGRPIIFQVMDVHSRVITGISISYESLNSYTGAMVALTNAMTSKKELCAKYGIEISDNEWKYCIPNRIFTDRGSFAGKQIEGAIANLGITIQQSPPYRADYKGVIESSFHQLNLKIKPFVDGVVINGKNKVEIGEQDHRLKANLTINEFARIVIKCILYHNNFHVLNDYITDEMMLEDGIEKVPNKIWEHSLKRRNGQVRILPEEVIKLALLPTGEATVTKKGILWKGVLFASEYTLRTGYFQRSRTKGTWKVRISYNPTDLTNIYMLKEDGKSFDKLTLLEHLNKFKGKCIEEIEQIIKFEQELNKKEKEKELQEKLKLFSEIESIVEEAREKTEQARDHSKSKAERIKGIKENNLREKLLNRNTPDIEIEDNYGLIQEITTDKNIDDELELFR